MLQFATRSPKDDTVMQLSTAPRFAPGSAAPSCEETIELLSRYNIQASELL